MPSAEKIGASIIRTVLPSVRESAGHVPAIPYVSGVILVVISCVKIKMYLRERFDLLPCPERVPRFRGLRFESFPCL